MCRCVIFEWVIKVFFQYIERSSVIYGRVKKILPKICKQCMYVFTNVNIRTIFIITKICWIWARNSANYLHILKLARNTLCVCFMHIQTIFTVVYNNQINMQIYLNALCPLSSDLSHNWFIFVCGLCLCIICILYIIECNHLLINHILFVCVPGRAFRVRALIPSMVISFYWKILRFGSFNARKIK